MHTTPIHESINLGEVSLLISFVTSPSDESTSSFYKRYFKDENSPIFGTYKKTLSSFLKESDGYSNNTINDLLYEPNGYLLFGRFDLLLLTLTDDIEFATRNFRPYPTIDFNDDFKTKNFDYQVFSTLTPQIGNISFNEKFLSFTTIDFQINNPFVSITQLKLNPSLLIGNGMFYLQDVLKKIDSVINGINNVCSNKHSIHYIYNINLGSHEIVLTLFSSSTNLLSETIYKIREISIIDFNDTYKINSTLNEFCDNEIDNISNMDNHVFVDTISNFGVSINFIENIPKEPNLDFKNLNFSTKWFVKPGHFNSAFLCISNELKKIKSDIELKPMLTLGRGDMILQAQVNFDENFIFLMDYIDLLNNKTDTIIHHIRESITSISFVLNNENIFLKYTDLEDVQNFKHKILMDKWLENRCSVEPIELNSIVNNLKKINAPKILAEKISSICNIFNNVIQDPVLFGSFIELESYIKLQIIKKIELASKPHALPFIYKKSNEEWFKELRDNSIIFEHAFYDRFFQTHRTADLTDINLDYKGAIHQLLSTYDALFKFYSYQIRLNTTKYKYKHPPYRKRIYSMIAPQVVYISDRIGIRSTKNSLRINQQHLFQPYIYLSVFIHEVCNFSMHSFIRAINKYDDEKYIKFSKYFNSYNFPNKHLYESKEDCIKLKDIVKKLLDENVFENENTKKAIDNIFNKHDDAFAYLYVDSFTYSVTFNRNIEQYSYWHIHYMLFQSNNLHESIHKISYDVYALIFFRLFMVYLINGIEINDRVIDEIINVTPDFYVLKKDHTEYRNFIISILASASIVFNYKEFSDFFKIINEFNNDIYSEFNFDKSLDSNKITYSIENNLELDYFKSRVDEFITNEVKDDNIYKSKLLDVIRHYIYLFHAYNGFRNNDLISIIERDKATGKVAISNENKTKLDGFADFCFDSQGGMFTTSAIIRKKIHIARSYVFIALWDFTQKYKKHYF